MKSAVSSSRAALRAKGAVAPNLRRLAMKTVRMILKFVKSAIGRESVRRRDRIQRQPIGEQMEPRDLLSGLKVDVAVPASVHPAGGGAIVFPVNQASSFHVTYQTNHEGASSLAALPESVEPGTTVQAGGATMLAMTAADSSASPEDDDSGDDDPAEVEEDNDDEINDENDGDGSP
jgi:hypothetical protein